MGQTWSSFYSYWFPNKEYKLVLVGLDNAGKTTTLYRLHLGQAVVTHPTVGSNVEQISFRNLEFEVQFLMHNATAAAFDLAVPDQKNKYTESHRFTLCLI